MAGLFPKPQPLITTLVAVETKLAAEGLTVGVILPALTCEAGYEPTVNLAVIDPELRLSCRLHVKEVPDAVFTVQVQALSTPQALPVTTIPPIFFTFASSAPPWKVRTNGVTAGLVAG